MGESNAVPLRTCRGVRGIARTARTCRKGDWIRYDFAEPLACRELAVRTGNLQLPRFTFTTGYVESSADGETFERVGELEKGGLTIRRPSKPIRAIRVVSTCEGNGCPLRDGAVARRQVNEEARRRSAGILQRIPAAFLRPSVRAGAIGGRFAPPRRRLIPAVLPFGPPRGSYRAASSYLCYRMFRRPDSVPVGAMYNFNYLRR